MPPSRRRSPDLNTRKGQKAAQRQFDEYGRLAMNSSIIARILGRSSPMVGNMIEQAQSGQIQGMADQFQKDLQKQYSQKLKSRQAKVDRRRQQQMTTGGQPTTRGTIVDYGMPRQKQRRQPRSNEAALYPRGEWGWTDQGWVEPPEGF